MANNSKDKGSAPSAGKTPRSKRVFSVVATIALAGVIFIFYYSFYVSSQRDYYNERAFRLLSTMGDSVSQQAKIAHDVIAAAASKDSSDLAAGYVQKALGGADDPREYITFRSFYKAKGITSSRDGALTLLSPDVPGTLTLPFIYRESTSNAPASQGDPCSDKTSPVVLCGTYHFEYFVRPNFSVLQENFFDDLLIADTRGKVLYQQSAQGVRITNAATLLSATPDTSLWKSLSKSGSDSTSRPPAPSGHADESDFSAFSSFSNVRDVELAGNSYRLYLQPLVVYVHTPEAQAEQQLVLCGLRSLDRARSEGLSLPYTYLIWGILVVLAVYALGWPLLKLLYMSPKERLQNRHVLYLIASAMAGTMLVTLVVLNLSYKQNYADDSEKELVQLSRKINTSVEDELRRALATLNGLASDPALLQATGTNAWNQKDFLAQTKYGKKFSQKKGTGWTYPYFRYFFIADQDGLQRLKFTVNSYTTPQINVSNEAYFPQMLACAHSPSAVKEGCAFRLQPVRSPNTGEFLVLLAAPFQLPTALPESDARRLASLNLRVKVLVVKMESLVNPVLPLGYGFAVVDRQGLVQFHSISTRNLTEDFTKESRSDKTVAALIENRDTDSTEAMYMGTEKRLRVTPIDVMGEPQLFLIVFRDAAFFNTLNAAVVVVFALLFSLYTIPFIALVLAYMIRRRDYPLEGIWPNPHLLRAYFHIFVANLFLTTVFFSRYISFGTGWALISVVAIALAAAIYPFLERRSDPHRFVGRSYVVLTLSLVAGLSWFQLFALLFAAITFIPPSRLREASFIGRIPVRYAFTLVALSILMVLVVIPCFGFFQIAYDYVHRIFLQEEQLELAEALEQRQESIHSFYASRNAEWLIPQRMAEGFGRYDSAFLNKLPSTPLPKLTALTPGLVERILTSVTAQLPSNALGVELRELASAQPPSDVAWSLSPPTRDATPQILQLAGPNHDPILSQYPSWPGISLRGGFFLIIAVIVLTVWLHFVNSRVFLLDHYNAPQLDRWGKEPSAARYWSEHLLVLGLPKSGKLSTVERIPCVQILDFAEMATTGKWQIDPRLPDVVALRHFEFDIDNPETNMKKLHVLEELMFVHHRKIIILSSVDPLYYFTASGADVVVPEKKNLAMVMQVLDRWGTVLTPFRKVRVDDITERGFRNALERIRARRTDPAFRRFVALVEAECDHTAQLRKIGKTMLRLHRAGKVLSKEDIIGEVLDRAAAYYRAVWATCTQDERLVLFQLAEDGWANLKNELAIQQLQRKGLVKCLPGLRIKNESFRRFIRESLYRSEEITTWEQEGEQSVWRSLKLSLAVAAAAVGVWLLYSQQAFFSTAVGYLSALGGAATVVIKLLSDLRGGKASQGSGGE